MLVAGCGDGEDRSGGPSSGLSTGTTSQGLAVSLDGDAGRAGVLATAWLGSCGRDGVPAMEPEAFSLGPLPATVDDTREDGDFELVEAYRRHLEVRAGGGSLRVRLDVTDLGSGEEEPTPRTRCSSGDVGFTLQQVPSPAVPEVTASAAGFRAADLQESVYETLSRVHRAVDGSDGARFCALITARLARRYCKGGPKATGERIYQQLYELDEVMANDDFTVRRTGRDASIVDLNDSGTSRFRFVPAGKRRWRLDTLSLNGSPPAVSRDTGRPPSPRAPAGTHTGTTSQGLAVNRHADGPGGADRVAIAWVGRCRRAGASTAGPLQQMETEDFMPGSFETRRREDVSPRRRATHLRRLQVQPGGSSYTGRLRVRTRIYDRKDRRVVSLCDSGPITFSTKPVGP